MGILRPASIHKWPRSLSPHPKLCSARLPTSPRKRGEVNWTRCACLYRARGPKCQMRGLWQGSTSQLRDHGVRERCVIRCRATPAEPFEGSGIDEPFATSMTQLTMAQ
jgi:hypothetical protein